MSYRDLRAAKADGLEEFYFKSLQYGHYLWKRGRAGRSILAVTRALYADLPETVDVLEKWPLPYAAIYWLVAKHPTDDFPGSPRVSFQHQAARIEGARKELRRARAWAVWSLICDAKPTLSGDSTQGIEEPERVSIGQALDRWGHRNERAIWRAALTGGFPR
jgi:hypothetical protein